MKFSSIILAFFLFCFEMTAQTLSDAVRFSFLEVGGTARTIGVGGATGALGADFSVLSTNPAGMAAFRRSEFTFTPTFVRSTEEELLEGAGNFKQDRSKNNFNFNNIGLVFSSRPLSADWTVSAFGLGLNRTANFHQTTYFEGISPGSITDRWLELADGFTPPNLDAFEGGVAFDADAIFRPDPDNFPTRYISDFPLNSPVNKSQLIRRSGAINELVFSYAGNYREKLMLGMTLGVPILSFEESKTYREIDRVNIIPFFEDLAYTERLRVTGAGINLKVGAIYRASQMVRLGAAIHTPTSFGLDENFTTEIQYNYLDPSSGIVQNGEGFSPDGSFEYRFRSPWRFLGSAGFIFGKNGFLSAEAEWVNYANAKFNFNRTSSQADIEYERDLNRQINSALTSAVNVRLGGEFVYERLRFRGGYALSAAPYAENSDPVSAVSVGVGARWESVFLDFAYQRRFSERRYAPYLTNFAPESVVARESFRSQFMLTFGFKF